MTGDPRPREGATGADDPRGHRGRRFDLEHTFWLLKQSLGWTRPKSPIPEAGDRWTWLIIVCHTQLRLARDVTTDLRRPWESPTRNDAAHPRPRSAADLATSTRRSPTPPMVPESSGMADMMGLTVRQLQ